MVYLVFIIIISHYYHLRGCYYNNTMILRAIALG